MNDGVPRLGTEVLLDEILESILAVDLLPVEDEGQTAVEEGVIPEQPLHVFAAVLVALEDRGIRFEPGAGSIAEGGLGNGLVILENAELETGGLDLSLPETLDAEFGGQGVDRLGAHPVQADGLGEGTLAVLGAGVDLGDTIDHGSVRNAPAVVPDLDGSVPDADLDGLAVAHEVLVDAVVDDLLEQHIDAVIRTCPIAELADVHARPEPDVLLPVERADVALRVVLSRLLRHAPFLEPCKVGRNRAHGGIQGAPFSTRSRLLSR